MEIDPEPGTEVWVRAGVCVEHARDPIGDLRVLITDTKASHWVMDVHREDILRDPRKGKP